MTAGKTSPGTKRDAYVYAEQATNKKIENESWQTRPEKLAFTGLSKNETTATSQHAQKNGERT